MSNQEIYTFKLRKIQTDQFAIIEDAFEEEKPVTMNTGLKFGLDEKAKVVMVSTLFRFKQEKQIFLLIETSCFFELASPTWELLQKGDTIVLPQNLAQHLVVIAIGTARGVLHSKTENTVFNRFFIPTLDVTHWVETDITIS